MTLRQQLAVSSRDDARIRPAIVVLVAIVLAFAFLLRFDAAISAYGTVADAAIDESTQRTLQAAAASLHPGTVEWERVERPYMGGDPVAYLNKARAMERFYAADIREPLYVASVKAGLWWFDDRDIGITFVSLGYSVLLVWATYLLGAFALCRWVGLAAALLIAGEFEIIGWSVQGWRDDAFAFFFVFSAYAFLRLAAKPGWSSAVTAGVAGGLATLTRITSLSFVLPGLAFALLPWVCGRFTPRGELPATFRTRIRAVAVAALLVIVLLGPFLLDCWIQYGDPLYSINFATRFYRERAGQDSEEAMDVGAYLSNQARTAPVAFADLAVNGFTTYPLTNKWRGFRHWGAPLPWMLSVLVLVGMGMFLWSPSGRYLLLFGFASMAPYAFTWRISGGAEWRFTMHVYPLYVLAAMWALDRLGRFLARLSRVDFRVDPLEQRALIHRIMVTAVLATGLYVTLLELPHGKLNEDLRAGRTVNLRAGEGDTRYFARGWYSPVAGPNVTARYDREPQALVRLPMVGGSDHLLTLRLQPYRDPEAASQQVDVRLNGEPLGTLTLGWDPNRVGSYDFQVPAAMVRDGFNRLTLTSAERFLASSESGNPFVVDGQRVGFFVWYVNVTALDVASGVR